MIWQRAIPRSTPGSDAWRRSVAGKTPDALRQVIVQAISAVEPCPDDTEHNQSGNDRDRNRPNADPDIADHLPIGFVLRDLAIALPVLVRRTHRQSPLGSLPSSPSTNREDVLAAFDEAHADARDFAGGLTAQALGAGPVAETCVIAGGRLALHIAMPAPAVVIVGAGQFGAAAQLRATGEPARVVRRLAVAKACEN